jgi:hypothetical protein
MVIQTVLDGTCLIGWADFRYTSSGQVAKSLHGEPVKAHSMQGTRADICRHFSSRGPKSLAYFTSSTRCQASNPGRSEKALPGSHLTPSNPSFSNLSFSKPIQRPTLRNFLDLFSTLHTLGLSCNLKRRISRVPCICVILVSFFSMQEYKHGPLPSCLPSAARPLDPVGLNHLVLSGSAPRILLGKRQLPSVLIGRQGGVGGLFWSVLTFSCLLGCSCRAGKPRQEALRGCGVRVALHP